MAGLTLLPPFIARSPAGRRLMLALAIAMASPGAQAHPDEAWARRAPLPPTTRPLLVVVADTSGAMAAPLEMRPAYAPLVDYAATLEPSRRCDPGRIYWRRGPGPAPDCASGQSVVWHDAGTGAGLACAAAESALEGRGAFVAARLAQWEARAGGGWWREPRAFATGALECREDRGRHGDQAGTMFAVHGAAGPWGATNAGEIDWQAAPLGDAYVLYTGNFLNYLQAPLVPEPTTAVAAMRQGLAAAADIAGDLDVALLRLSDDGGIGDYAGEGGYVLRAAGETPESLAAVAAGLPATGASPIGEALAEAAAYLAGAPLAFGDHSHSAPGVPAPSVAASRDPADPLRYRSPFTHACRPATLALVTAGAPSADGGTIAALSALPALGAATTDCGEDCAAPLLAALATTDLHAGLPGAQRAPTVVIAAGPEAVRLARQATRPVVSLDDPLAWVNVAARALSEDAAVPAPLLPVATAFLGPSAGAVATVAVTTFTAPSFGGRWPGNVAAFALQPGAGGAPPTLVDRDGRPVRDPATGLLAAGIRDLWAAPDAADGALGGGAASRLPLPAARRVYTNLVDGALSDARNAVERGNTGLDGWLREAVTDPAERRAVVDWWRGADAFDADHDGDTTEPLAQLGAPGRGPPVALSYGADGPRRVFVVTADGALHSLDADDGSEQWAFVPRGLLKRALDLATGVTTPGRLRGIGGEPRLHVHDADHNGRIMRAAGDHAWLAFGIGRGGQAYLGVDVTDADAPVVMWSLGPGELPGLGLATAAPVIARLPVTGATQNVGRWVAVLAGGSDPAGDSTVLPAAAAGNALYVVDAASGVLLWSAGGEPAPGVDLVLTAMREALPAAPRVLDLDGDGAVDHVFAVDAAGGAWRFDFAAGRTRDTLAAGGRHAALGAATDPLRRFDVEPDVAFARAADGRRYLAISFGSGWLARPGTTVAIDRFYSLRDYRLGVLDAAAFGAARPLREADLDDVTGVAPAMTASSAGWFVRLEEDGPGERTVGRAVTFGGVVRFATWRPVPAAPTEPCGPPRGRSRLRSLDLLSGRPVHRVLEDPAEPEPPDEAVSEFGLPAAAAVVLPPMTAGCSSVDCHPAPFVVLGVDLLPLDFANDPVRTTWRELDAAASR